ncbi:hypothetical protein PY546_14555 [Providencia stuartii]|nr:hypothetical protein [Providencia stuartii]
MKAVFPGETGPVAPYEVSSGNGGKDSGLTGFSIPAQPASNKCRLCAIAVCQAGIPSSAYIQCLRAGISAALCKVMSSRFEHQFGMMMFSFQNKKEGLSREEQALTGKMSVVNR